MCVILYTKIEYKNNDFLKIIKFIIYLHYLLFLFSRSVMVYCKDNIIHGADIPKYLLDSKSNLSQYFTRMLGDLNENTAMVCNLFENK